MAIGMALGGLMGMAGQGGMNFLSGMQQDYFARRAIDREYSYAQRYAKEGPSWQVEGLKRAGLNPILAASGGMKPGAVAPRSSPSVPKQDPVNVAAAFKLRAETKQIEAQTELLKQQGQSTAAKRPLELDTIMETANNLRSSTAVNKRRKEEINERLLEIQAHVRKMKEETGRLNAEQWLAQRQKELMAIVDEMVGPLAAPGSAKFGADLAKIIFKGIMSLLTRD